MDCSEITASQRKEQKGMESTVGEIEATLTSDRIVRMSLVICSRTDLIQVENTVNMLQQTSK